MVRGTDCVSWSLTLEAKDVETGGIVSLAILETSQTHTNTNEEKHTNTNTHALTLEANDVETGLFFARSSETLETLRPSQTHKCKTHE